MKEQRITSLSSVDQISVDGHNNTQAMIIQLIWKKEIWSMHVYQEETEAKTIKNYEAP